MRRAPEFSYQVVQADLIVAEVTASDDGDALREIMHYAIVYAQALLGGKVALSVIAIIGGFLLGIRGFQRAGDAMDKVLAGRRRSWFAVALWLGLAFGGVGIAAAVPTYWLSPSAASEPQGQNSDNHAQEHIIGSPADPKGANRDGRMTAAPNDTNGAQGKIAAEPNSQEISSDG